MVVLLGALWAAPSADANAFCEPRIVRDYEAPLRALPPASPVPSSLPFAPPGLQATPFRSTGQGLLYRGVRPSLNLWNEGAPIELSWIVKLLVSRPAADGSVGEVVSETTGWVGEVGRSNALVARKALAELGTYRVDTSFESQSGEVLGSYFEYVRVVPLTRHVRLSLNRQVVSPGGSFKVRVENVGTGQVSFGLPYVLERRHEGRWLPAPQRRRFFMPRIHLGAGIAGECEVVRVFAWADPGRYRIRKRVSLSPIRSETGFAPPMAIEKLISKVFWVKPRPTA
jgi:hypothetical protein